MGCCGSSDEQSKLNKDVGSELQKDSKIDKETRKLLFLGSGGSGKSTLFKQLRTIHGEGFEDDARMGYKNHIYSQIIEQMQELIISLEDLKEDYPKKFEELEYSKEGEKARDFIENCRGDKDINEQIANNIEILWKEDCIRATFDERARLKIHDSSAYFFDEVHRISQKSYIPLDKDILMVRHRTTGVIEQKFEIHKTLFHVFDVGGQKSERKKWIHCFENVTAVIFVASLSCYNEVMYEDESINSMHDSLDLFDEICNLRWFERTAVILFLNKKDLFADKIQNVPLTVCFEDYNGENNYEEGIDYIKTQFENKNQNPDEKEIYTHFTMATDKNNVEKVFGDVQHIVINLSLTKSALI